MQLVNHKITKRFINLRQSPAIITSLALKTEQSKYILNALHEISLTIPLKFNSLLLISKKVFIPK